METTRDQGQLAGILRNCTRKLQAHHIDDWQYTAIIVDEGQDIEKDLFGAIQELLRDQSNNYFFVFYDEAQRIDFETPWRIPGKEMLYAPTLRINCRNTQSIFNFMQTYNPHRYTQITPFLIGPIGIAPEFIAEKPQSGQTPTEWTSHQLLKLLDRLINKEKIAPEHILLLTCRSKEKSNYPSWKANESWKKQGITLRHLDENPGERDISLLTIRASKGLESYIVILIELDGLPTKIPLRHKLLYIGLSRAKHRLYILGSEAEMRGVDSPVEETAGR